MKKIAVLVLALTLALCAAGAMAEIKLGQVQCAAHGTKCFAVITAAVDGDKIAAAYIDEYQLMDKTATVSVPNAAAMFGEEADNLLASKRVNSEYYSDMMASHAGATVKLDANYSAIEAHVAGMTVADLEAEISGFGDDSAKAVDAVSGCTLQDTLGYLKGILDAAKAAK